MNQLTSLQNEKISTLFWRYTLPSIAGSIILAIYVAIDSIFIGHGPGLGVHALGGFGIVVPLMNLLSALGTLVGAGTASRISIYLGQGNKDMALQVMGTSLLFTFLISIVPILGIYVFMDPILWWLGVTSETYKFARDFLHFYLPAALLLNMGTTFTNILKATGFPKQSMYVMVISVIFNIILAPIFIFVFKWEMKGAGAAASLSAFLAGFAIIPYCIGKNKIVSIKSSDVRLRPKVIYNIVNIGFAPFLITAMTSLIFAITNKQLVLYGGDIAQAGYTVATRIHYIFLMTFTGISQGIQPIIGYNYGSGNYKRMFSTLNYAFKVAFCVGLVAFLSGTFAGKYLVQIFTSDPALIPDATKAVFVLLVTLPLAGCQILISGFFQHIGVAVKSAMLSLTRQVFFFIPMIFILPLFWGVDGVWASLPFSEILAVFLTFIVFYFQKKKMLKNT